MLWFLVYLTKLVHFLNLCGFVLWDNLRVVIKLMPVRWAGLVDEMNC
jgi:hypothetical protein